MKEDREEKFIKIIKILVIVFIIVLTIVLKTVPELKKMLGSSDNFINYNDYEATIGIRTTTGTNVILVIESNKVTNIIFLDNTALCLYNKDIENKDIKTALNKIINTLISNQNISDNSIILVKYSDNKYYEEVKKALGKLLNVEEINETLQQTAKLYQGIEIYEDDKLELQSLDTYSKRLIKDYKNAQIVEEIENKMTEEEATTYAKRVYEKLNYYAQDVENQAKESTELPIIQIPANPELTIYPTSESWYYIKNHQVYAYIKFKSSPKDYDFCYNGNINNMKKGKCS